MTVSQVIIYAVLALLVMAYLRKFLLSRRVSQYTPAQVAQKLQAAGPPVLLDVRTEGERKGQSIKGSLHIPLASLTVRSKELESYRQREIICYCQTGNRSVSAALKLRRLGFTAASMKGGIAEWNFSHLAR